MNSLYNRHINPLHLVNKSYFFFRYESKSYSSFSYDIEYFLGFGSFFIFRDSVNILFCVFLQWCVCVFTFNSLSCLVFISGYVVSCGLNSSKLKVINTIFSFIIHFTLFSVHWLKVFINSVVKRKEFKNRKGMRDVFTYVCLSLVVGDFFVLIFWICFCFYKWRPSRDLSTKPESP